MAEQVLACGHVKDGQVGYVHVGATGETVCQPCYNARKRAAYAPKVLRRERRDLKKCIGATTLAGSIPLPQDIKRERLLGDRFPLSHGNHCNILNMYTENVDEALKRWPDLQDDCEVEIVEWQGRERVRVVDRRIPRHWLRHDCDHCGVYEEVGGAQ